MYGFSNTKRKGLFGWSLCKSDRLNSANVNKDTRGAIYKSIKFKGNVSCQTSKLNENEIKICKKKSDCLESKIGSNQNILIYFV